jgi:hypothetical protein
MQPNLTKRDPSYERSACILHCAKYDAMLKSRTAGLLDTRVRYSRARPRFICDPLKIYQLIHQNDIEPTEDKRRISFLPALQGTCYEGNETKHEFRL